VDTPRARVLAVSRPCSPVSDVGGNLRASEGEQHGRYAEVEERTEGFELIPCAAGARCRSDRMIYFPRPQPRMRRNSRSSLVTRVPPPSHVGLGLHAPLRRAREFGTRRFVRVRRLLNINPKTTSA
jgi:hypothetical protein